MASEDEPRAGDDRELASASGPLAGADGDPAGADRDPARADHMTPLERHARWLLRLYPATYRRERGEEIIGTLLEASDGRTWPRLRDVRGLAVGGLRARASQNRQRTTSANLRVAVMAGLAMYLSLWSAVYLDGAVQGLVPNSVQPAGWTNWPSAVTALLVGATVVLAWTGPRVGVLAGALAASAGVVSFALVVAGPAAVLGPRLVQVLALVGLAALAPRAGHPSRHWLWLPGVIVVSSLLLETGVGYGWLGYTTWGLFAPGLPPLAIMVGGIVWIVIDARLAVAAMTCIVMTLVQTGAAYIGNGPGLSWLIPLLIAVAIATPAIWLLRRQSGRAVG
jgi:hypothetical protein